ncbi:hypothetical protein [Roseibium sp.]|uniref:hypothetical protein n=1 Tax=Roseibium sp. TaxID=1936156 RepID=UPI003A97B949
MGGSLEILLGGPAHGAVLMALAEQAAAERSAGMMKPQRETLRRLLVDAAAGRVYLALVRGREAGHVIVTFGVSVRSAGRVAMIEECFVSRDYRGSGFEERIIRAVLRDLSAFGLVEATLLCSGACGIEEVVARVGFTPSGERMYRIALDEPGDD